MFRDLLAPETFRDISRPWVIAGITWCQRRVKTEHFSPVEN